MIESVYIQVDGFGESDMNLLRNLFGGSRASASRMSPAQIGGLAKGVRQALESICLEYLNKGRWDDLPFAAFGCKPFLPGQMVFSLEMAERPKSGGLYDAYVVFSMGGGCVIFVGATASEAACTIDQAKTLLRRALDYSHYPRVEAI